MLRLRRRRRPRHLRTRARRQTLSTAAAGPAPAAQRALKACVRAVQDDTDPDAQGLAAVELHGLLSAAHTQHDAETTPAATGRPAPPPAAHEICAWDASPTGLLLDRLYTAGGGGSGGTDGMGTKTTTKNITDAVSVNTSRSLVFGRVPPSSLAVVFDRIQERGGLLDLDRTGGGSADGTATPNTFVDIGSGDGLVCLGAALILPFDTSEGFEVVSSLHAASESLSRRVSAWIAEADGVSCGDISFHLADARQSSWAHARVVFTNCPAFDGSLMQSLTERAALMTPGTFFITVGQPLSSPHFQLVDKVLLPANGRGKHGGKVKERDEDQEEDEDQAGHHAAVNDEADADVGEEMRLRTSGLYDFFVYQRLVDYHQASSAPVAAFASTDVLQRAVSDTEIQRMLRGHDGDGVGDGGGGAKEGTQGGSCALAALCAMLSPQVHMTDQARTASALTLHASMACEPSMRTATEAGIVNASLSLIEEGKGILGVCGILLLSAVAAHSYGARGIVRGEANATTSTGLVSHDARLRAALGDILAPSSLSPAPVVSAAIEVLLCLANAGHDGLVFVKNSKELRSRIRELASGGDDRAHLVEQTVITLLAERDGLSDGRDRTALMMLDLLGGTNDLGGDIDESDAERLRDAVAFLEMAAEEGN